jgi:hypothetical protein
MEGSVAYQEQDDEDGTDPETGNPGRSVWAGLYPSGRRQPIDPEGDPTNENDNVNDMHRESSDHARRGEPGCVIAQWHPGAVQRLNRAARRLLAMPGRQSGNSP